MIVRATKDSAMQGRMPMDDTDFKEVFRSAYAQVQARQTERARREHEHRLTTAERARSAPPENSQDKPARSPDGSYPLLLASMRTGEVTEVRPDNIKRWSEPTRETISGTTYWVVNVTFETLTMFGNFDTEVQALVKNNRVDRWVYTGSGEVVP